MLSDVPSALLISDQKVTRKYIWYALNLVFVLIDVYLLLISCITFLSLYLSDVKVNLSLIFSWILLCLRSLIRLSSHILVTNDVPHVYFSESGL